MASSNNNIVNSSQLPMNSIPMINNNVVGDIYSSSTTLDSQHDLSSTHNSQSNNTSDMYNYNYNGSNIQTPTNTASVNNYSKSLSTPTQSIQLMSSNSIINRTNNSNIGYNYPSNNLNNNPTIPPGITSNSNNSFNNNNNINNNNNNDNYNDNNNKNNNNVNANYTNSGVHKTNIPPNTIVISDVPPIKKSSDIVINKINENGKKAATNVIDLTSDDDVKIISSSYNGMENPYKRQHLATTHMNNNYMYNNQNRNHNLNPNLNPNIPPSRNNSNHVVIDLTNENYVIQEPVQCFGTISTLIYCVKNPMFYSISNELSVMLYPYKNNLHVLIEKNTPIAVGILEPAVSECLYPLFQRLKYDAKIPRTLKMPSPNTLRVAITLFGTKSIAKILGPLLYKNKVNISIPLITLPQGMLYYNPVSGFGHIPLDANFKSTSNSSTSSNNYAYQNMKMQIDSVFDSLKSIDELPELNPNSLIRTPLYKYQKQALYFMVQREKEADDDYFKNDSLWKLKESKLKNGIPEYVNLITKNVSKKKPKKVQGGIIADDMGLGKTFQMLCLITYYYNEITIPKDGDLSQLPDVDFSEDYLKEDDSDLEIISTTTSKGEVKMNKNYINTKATLIICPLSVVSNWDEQINTHVRTGALKVYIHHGSNRLQDPSIMVNYDIVISTYNVLALEYNKEKNNEAYCAPLHKIEWFRIILDEAHYIKEAQTLQSRAACELAGKRRWCLSGTPMQNKIDDLYGLIRFLDLEPFNKKSVWVNYITKPMRYYDKIGISSLQTLMKSISIRRTKESTIQGKKLIQLPPKSNEYIKLQLSPEAREVYTRVLKQGKIIFQGLVNQGIWAKHYVHILEIILRLRQIATHLSLCNNKDLSSLKDLTGPISLDTDEVKDETKALEIYNILKESAENQCLICGYDVDNLDRRGYITSCGHLYCTDCLKSKDIFTCIECQKDVRKNQAIIIPKVESKPTNEFFINEVEVDGVNVKVNRLINDLLRDRQMNDKSIVFSQWTKVFDLLDSHLKKANINYVRLDGQMSRIKRNESIQKFKNDPNISVMLISLKAGGLGLTLTVASRVYLFEPHFNPAAENQAIDRVHRLGQDKPVFVYHYIMENTIEENIVNLQNKKRTLFSLTFNRNKKLTKEEIENRRLADLKYLFK
ncbi:hypothetical protein BCR32DRAFT_271920 [Anaeromyces robustus]|uniref:Uncharacterized protein n=1 Tax=Anaeromyces robustus TaxID=1754192 RepID=A0A1Y1WPE6_9FUNG|nr:hypothetical protein BCR32DRAFT_271920 [Anaeromyces robustus]|eukprot:ORX75417.1 hypothetical protein BCR32DRAFT_271920 [Anaeromyces robustus]